MTYQITEHHHLSPEKIRLLHTLRDACRSEDAYDIPLYEYILEKNRPFLGTFLTTQNDVLIAFLGVFFFYHDACEIVLMVHPEMRCRGIARSLIDLAAPLIVSRDVKSVVVASPTEVLQPYFLKKNYIYLYKEYRMLWGPEPLPEVASPRVDITCQLATETDRLDLVLLDEVCFNTLREDALARYQDILSDTRYQIAVVKKNNQIIGKVHFHYREYGVQLSDLAVFPAFQKQGIGKYLLGYGLKYVAPKNVPVYLDVSITNERALGLYLQAGFKIVNACDYWRIPVKQFLQIS